MDDKPLLSSLLFSSKHPNKHTDEEKQNTIHLDKFDLHRNNSIKKTWKLSINKNNLQNLLSEQDQVFSFKQILNRFERHTAKNKYNKHYFSLLTELLCKKISNKEYLKQRSSLVHKEKSKKINFGNNSNSHLYINFLTNPGNHSENKDFSSSKFNDFLFDSDYKTLDTNKFSGKITTFPLTQRSKLIKRQLLCKEKIYNEGCKNLLKECDPVEDFILNRNKKKYVEYLENKNKFFDLPSNNKLSRKRFLRYQKFKNISERKPIELDKKKPESMILKRIRREKQNKSNNNKILSKTAINFRQKTPKIQKNHDENNDKLLQEIYFSIKNSCCK